jgi:D-alanyl-D-alanine carboxypeptidase
MLPSGNDAAVSLAEGVGWMLKMEESNGIEQIQ